MSSIDDLSLISGISNISRISRATGASLYKFDSTCNLSEWRSMCRDVNKSFTTESQKLDARRPSESTKINKALNSCEESTCDYAKLKLIYQCLEEVVSTNSITVDKNTMKKLKELITIHEVKKYLHLPNTSKDLKEELTLLGIIDLPQYEFSYEEQLSIKSCLEAKIREKIHSFVKMYENLAGSTKEVLKNNDSILRSRLQQKEELDNIHWKDKIDEVCMEHKRDLLHCRKMLNQWNELRCKINEKITKDSENLLLQAEIAEMKVIISKLTCTIRMYKETPETVEAFRILNASLDEQIARVNEEIAEKIELKKAYDVLNNTEYDEILRKYLDMCHIVKKKRNLLEKL
ncbi:uncharacterized protein LOC100679700 [Nasonia vitripennis]|uniref:Uncharacterized protein n=1 Tax=Nasonia vitripennis TaxID=7425 RepID=A0A7M7LNG8_NASVI|nr:uncharacterized protein LOC100679700 [Nasonia vitripennis]